MAYLASIRSGNFTTSTTWGVLDTTSLLYSEAGSTTITNAFVSSSSFTPGAITISGLIVNLRTIVTTTGTFSVRLAIAGVAVAGTTVTINVADIPPIGTGASGTLIYMKFSAPVLLLAATAYTLQMTVSSTGSLTAFTNGIAANWSRGLVTTTNAAPASTDTMTTCGEYTSAGVNAVYTVTMNNTTTTTWGTVANSSLWVGANSIFTWGTSASTNYYFKAGGSIVIQTGGQFIIGTPGTPMPSTSTATLEMAVTSALQFSILRRNMGVFKSYGSTKQTWDLLGASASAAATSLTTTTSNPTGWKNLDNIVLAPTTNAPGTFDLRVINTVSGTTTTITAGLTNAKTLVAGTYGVECEIINLTRNIRIIGGTTAFYSQLNEQLAGTTEMYYTEMRFMNHVPSSTVGNSTYKYGCSMWDLSSALNFYPGGGAIRSTLIENEVHHNAAAVTGFGSAGATGAINYEFRDCVSIRGTSGTQGIYSNSGGGIYLTRVRAIGGGNTNISIGNNAPIITPIYIKDCIAKSGSVGIQISIAYAAQEIALALIENFKGYLNTATGMAIVSNGWIVDGGNLYSNATANMQISGNSNIIKNVTMNAGTVATISPIGVNPFANTTAFNNTFINCSMGATTTHANGDVRITSGSTTYADSDILFQNCIFGSATEIGLQTSLGGTTRIRSARHDQTNGSNRIWMRAGTQSTDSVIYDTTTTGTKSVRLTPLIAAQKLKSTTMSVAVKNGNFITVSVKVRCSVVGDGVVYNGNRPRLMLLTNTASTIQTTDTVLATAGVAANGAFQTLTATIPTAVIDDCGVSFYIDCDGTAGWVNYDTFKIT